MKRTWLKRAWSHAGKDRASMRLCFELLHKQLFHILVLFPNIADRLICKGRRVHIGRWTKLGRNIQIFSAIPLMLIDDLLPQSQMCRHSVLPFRGAWIRDLWAFGIAHARMNIVRAG